MLDLAQDAPESALPDLSQLMTCQRNAAQSYSPTPGTSTGIYPTTSLFTLEARAGLRRKQTNFFPLAKPCAFGMRTVEMTPSPRWVPRSCPGEARTRNGALLGWPRLGKVTRPRSASGQDRERLREGQLRVTEFPDEPSQDHLFPLNQPPSPEN